MVPLDGGPDQALRCFEGLAAQPETPTHEVIVVDDAAGGLRPLLDRLAGDVRVIRNERRLGFEGAARMGAEHARAPVTVVVRRGAVPGPGWLEPLVAALADPAVGLAASAAHPLQAWSVAMRRAELLAMAPGGLEESLVIGGWALAAAQHGRRVVPVAASSIQPPGARVASARRRPGEPPALTVVIPTLDAASERVRRCLAALEVGTEEAHQIVLVDNGAPPQGFSAPVNAGLRAARTPYLVVMNDDVEPLPGWWPPLRASLDAGAAVAFPLTVGGPMRLDFAAWCFALTERTVTEFAHGPGDFFDPSLVIWYQDTDLLHRLRRAGRPPQFVEAARIRHGLSESVGTTDAALAEWIREQIWTDRERFVRKHPDATLVGHQLAA